MRLQHINELLSKILKKLLLILLQLLVCYNPGTRRLVESRRITNARLTDVSASKEVWQLIDFSTMILLSLKQKRRCLNLEAKF